MYILILVMIAFVTLKSWTFLHSGDKFIDKSRLQDTLSFGRQKSLINAT